MTNKKEKNNESFVSSDQKTELNEEELNKVNGGSCVEKEMPYNNLINKKVRIIKTGQIGQVTRAYSVTNGPFSWVAYIIILNNGDEVRVESSTEFEEIS